LGFGCAYLTPENAHVLDAAFDAGIRHFDVGRSYGRGLTEGLLGRFIKRHQGEITVTSKYGIKPPFSHPLHGVARAVIKPILRRIRRSARIERRLDALPLLNTQKALFQGAEARESLALSLRNLRLDRLDVFLMHEAEPADLADAGLLDMLRDAASRGQIGSFGVGGKSTHLPQLRIQRPEYCRVLQYDWTPPSPVPSLSGSLSIVYRVAGEPVKRVRGELHADPDLCRHWSQEVGWDLHARGAFEQLMLHAAVALRPDALVLFSSTRPEHIVANVRAATDGAMRASALRLCEMLRARQAAAGVGPP
jgi:diketogulonate reductase-like aldo/keto reductase